MGHKLNKITPEDLPFPPSGKSGWPWEVPSSKLQESFNEGFKWPKISIVTPSYNQGKFLEETIRSVLLQEYPNLEYIVIDGGSTDNSVEIIRKYEPWLSYWVSEQDRGQSHAINKGFSKVNGTILAWLNSDDMYMPETLKTVAEFWIRKQCDVMSGHALFIDEHGRFEGRFNASPVSASDLIGIRAFTVPQQATFWSRDCWDKFGPLSEDLHYTMDYEFWINLSAANVKWEIIDSDLALFRHHPEQKTAGLPLNLEVLEEKRHLLQRFRHTSLCGKKYTKDVRRGLNEIWVKEWKIKNRDRRNPVSFFLSWLCAPFQNWQCLKLPAYYGALYYRVACRR